MAGLGVTQHLRSYKMSNSIYTKTTNILGLEIIHRVDEDGSEYWIPPDPANSDYQVYLASLDEAATL